MHKLLGIATATVLGLAASLSTASAADMPLKASPRPLAPIFTWTGCYAGVEGGWSFGHNNLTFADDGTLAANVYVDGGLVGGTLGCNLQNGSWLVGIETDLSWSGLKGTTLELNADPGENLGVKSNWLNTDRVRLGYAVDRSLWYVTGGAAVRDIQVTQNDPVIPQTVTLSNTRVGWTAGVGAEVAFSDPRWSWKVEYLYADYGNVFMGFSAVSGGNFADKNSHLIENIVRAGINFHFH